MSWSRAAASRRSASSPRAPARERARCATPRVCAQRRGKGSSFRRSRAISAAHVAWLMRPMARPSDAQPQQAYGSSVWAPFAH
jgi:hypothetical protein